MCSCACIPLSMSNKKNIALFLFLVMPAVQLYTYMHVRGVQRTVEKGSLFYEARRSMDENKPLELPTCFKTTPIVSLKTKGMEIRRRYNIRHNLCQALRAHLQELCECQYISVAANDKIIARIQNIEVGNEELKKQFENVTAYLEEQRARHIADSYESEVNETMKRLEAQNEELLRRVTLPQDDIRDSFIQKQEKTRQQQVSAESFGELSNPKMGERTSLDSMIANMQALRCRKSDSEIYQKRLLTLLPMIRNGAYVNLTLPETKGNTALHYSCAIGSWSITQWLVEHGANVNAATNAGKTPLDCVGSDNGKRIRELLISRGARRSTESSQTSSYTTNYGGDADSLNSLGLAYQYGKNGKPKNYNEAARCYRLATEQGHAGAQNNLGFCYHNGWGVPKDMGQAAMWYRRSAEQGNAWGQSNYGTCLEYGWGVSKNLSAAIDMYRRAAAQGHASAKKHLKRHGIYM